MSSVTFSRPSRGDVLELTIDSLAHGGNGVARLEGYVVFVAGAVPGDRVRAEVGKAKKAYAEARAIEIVEPSPERVPEFADHPGAPWQVLSYERQLEVKFEQVADALKRIGKLEDFELEPIVPALEQWRYRNKLEYSFGTSPEGELVCGFHAPGRWNDIVPMVDCKLASERSNELREQVLAFCREQGLGAWDRRDQQGFLRNLVIREGRRTGQTQVRLVTSPGKLDIDGLIAAVDADGLWWTQTADLGESTYGGEHTLLSGNPQLTERLSGLDFLISPEAFFQTNTEMAEVLYGVANEFAALHGTEKVFDLYCGIGTIGLTLATKARKVIGLEIVESAAADAIENAKINEIENASFYAGDARLALKELVEKEGKPDLAVIDPPRAGLSQKIVRRIVDASPSRIVYVSCNPTTLAPNAAQLVEAGYRLVKVRPVDMFPQTPHIECVALFEAGPDGVQNPDRET
jgi:23S rRNA (uracil1939-C5)-methyltransferase